MSIRNPIIKTAFLVHVDRLAYTRKIPTLFSCLELSFAARQHNFFRAANPRCGFHRSHEEMNKRVEWVERRHYPPSTKGCLISWRLVKFCWLCTDHWSFLSDLAVKEIQCICLLFFFLSCSTHLTMVQVTIIHQKTLREINKCTLLVSLHCKVAK